MLPKYCVLLVVLVHSLNPAPPVHAQNDNRPGYVSIDCGLPEGSDYRDDYSGIYYKSDANLIDSGESKNLSPSLVGNLLENYLSRVRSFPRGKKNCYTIKPPLGKGTKYLIRATFMYGNYDFLNQFPAFDLNLGADTWSKIQIEGDLIVERPEIIHILSSDYIHVCLIDTGTGTPFISALELRPLSSTNSVYTIDSGSLEKLHRINCDSTTTTTIRYKDDIYDRMWRPIKLTNTEISTLLDINNRNEYLVPLEVLKTACTPDNISDALHFSWNTTNTSDQFYMYMHFAEVEKLQVNQTREFDIYINKKQWNQELVALQYLTLSTLYPVVPETGKTEYKISINKTESSTLPPIINAFEIFTIRKFSNTGTNETDVAAILDIKSSYGLIRDWQGDPCEPQDFVWEGLKCSYHSSDYSARIISLNLTKSGLTGEILSSIANLTQLKTLDISNNNLSGQVPSFLSQLDLSVLNIKGNNFTGQIPAQLLENQKRGILTLSFDGLGLDTNTEKKSNISTNAVVGIVVVSVVFLAAIITFSIWIIRRRILQGKHTQVNKGDIERKNRKYSYSEVVNITRNFERVLGKGGFGTVYHGYVGEREVAVKMLSSSSTQGHKDFQNEASLLMSVSHKNLTSLVGYCNEGTNMGIICEYMANSSLDRYLSGKSTFVLSWEMRIQIALDAAQGLEYLHHGCKPAIIHRDVKPSNILLNKQFQAKLADFGLSRAFPVEGGSHVSTVVAGSPGYLDPEYYTLNRITEKSDVYSFGVVLLALITGRPAILETENRTHISQWVDSIVQYGDVKQVVEPRLEENFDVNSVWKAVELAMTCASRISSRRPTMNTVVMDLKECLSLEMSSHEADSNINSIGMVSVMDVEASLFPRPR